jgi:serine/threonine protein phosphatase 1
MVLASIKKMFSGTNAEPAAQPRLPEGVRIYAIGDVHGRVDLLERLYGLMQEDRKQHPVAKTMEVMLGDYVDRGPRSKDVIDWLLTGPNLADKRICLRGNHELMMQAFLDDASVIGSWGQYGGLETLYSYGLKFKMPIAEEAHEEIQAQLRDALPAPTLSSSSPCGPLRRLVDTSLLMQG